MAKASAGILLYRFSDGELQVLLVHPGGPLWAKKDEGAWSVPKGEYEPGEEALAAAIRELQEETGIIITGDLIALSPIKQKSGKIVHAWLAAGDIDPEQIRSNTFEMQWPPKSGKMQSFPEVDKAGWFSIATAGKKINSGQLPLLKEAELILQP
ncbi:NUDIX domain-containing protein [Chitinophagaceae bacterium MMS25-I14]